MGILLSATLLVACGGGGGGGDNPKVDPPLESTITVVPSLGAMSDATVNIYKSDGITLLGTGNLGSTGQATIVVNGYSGPVIIEIAGNASAKYYDSAAGALVDFPAGTSIHAIAPVSSGTFAVTMLTELAYQEAVASNDIPLNAATVTLLNTIIQSWFIPEIDNLLTVPTLFDSSTTVGSFGNDAAGKYAIRLAALAQLGDAQTAPMLAVMIALIEDIKDGVVDGKNGTLTVNAPYSDFWVQLATQLSAMADNYGTPDLKTTVASYPPIAIANTTTQSLTVGTAMSSFTPLIAIGGVPPYTFSYTGTLPSGLSFSTSTGAVTGIPDASYATAGLVFSVQGANSAVASTTSTVSFTVYAAPPPPSPGSLDVSFNSNGIVLTDIDTFGDSANAVAIQTDGKIVAVGTAFTTATLGYDFALVRYNEDGSLDTNFGTGGKVTTDLGGSLDSANAMAIQSDGKIIAAGRNYDSTGAGGLALVRYNTNGTLDTTFGTGGKVTTNLGTGDFALAVSLQSDDKIIVASSSYIGFGLARYNTDGGLDTTFGTNGRVDTAIYTTVPGYNSLSNIAIQADDKIVAIGTANPTYDFALARYTVDGSLDTTFGTGGKVTTDIGGLDFGHAVTIQKDGKIVAAGQGAASGAAVTRYNEDGSLDMAFGTNGIVTTYTTGSVENPSVVLIQGDGKIVTVGTGLIGGSSGIFSLARYNTDGTLDTSFDVDGKLTTVVGVGQNTLAYAAALQNDISGNTVKIIAAGTASGDFALVRYLP